MQWDRIAAAAYTVVFVGVIVAVPLALWWHGFGIFALVLALPMVGWLGARVLVHGGFGAFEWLSRMPFMGWEGSYYEFNGVQVRVYEADGELWFVVPDVVRSVGMKKVPESFHAVHPTDVRNVPGKRLKALNPAGVEHLLSRRHEHEAMRFLNWMAREVVGPWEKRASR
jgi:hypothetical protein